jgi:hypothetical protein
MRYLIAISTLIAACATTVPIGEAIEIPTQVQRSLDLNASVERWRSWDVGDYRYSRESISAWCPGPSVEVTVRNNSVVSVRYVRDGRSCDGKVTYKAGKSALRHLPALGASIDDLLSEIAAPSDGCLIRQATFHPEYGFPLSLFKCGVLEDGTVIEDAGHGYRIVSFETI